MRSERAVQVRSVLWSGAGIYTFAARLRIRSAGWPACSPVCRIEAAWDGQRMTLSRLRQEGPLHPP
jgi:hypothetical protein